MAPNVGQGANSALVDAAVLVAEVRRAATLSDGLATYERRRMKPVRRVADVASQLGRLAELTHPAARFVRDRMLLPVANRFASQRAIAQILQEPTETLLALGNSQAP
jgi:2-polyprenyl-6-methoxyphenol hydroxylase-like FAD-dependent oxidoreductase